MFILTETVFKVLETHIYTHDDDPVPGDSWDETKKIENYGPYPTRIGAERKIKALARELIKKGMHGVKRYDGYLLTWPYNPRSHNQPPEEDDVILSIVPVLLNTRDLTKQEIKKLGLRVK